MAQTRSEHDERRNCTMGDVHPGACPWSRGGAARGESWRGVVVRHSANVTYCLFRGGVHETPCRSMDEGMIGAADIGVLLYS